MGTFFKSKRDSESVKEETGGKYIGKSGIYDVTVLAPFVSQGSGEVMGVDFFVDYNGQPQVIYGNLKLTNRDGSENFGAVLFNKFTVIADVDEVSDPVSGELPIGKQGAMKDVDILEDLADVEVKMRIQMEYTIYNGNINEKTVIKSFYRASDGASAEEIVNDADFGAQLEKDLPYAENITFKDGLDAEIVAKWIADKRPKGTANAGASATKKPSFGKKSFGK